MAGNLLDLTLNNGKTSNALVPIKPLQYPLKMFTDIKCDYMLFKIKKYQMVSSRTANSIYRNTTPVAQIAMYMSPNQSVSYNMQWGESDMGLIKLLEGIDMTGDANDFLKTAMSKLKDAGALIATRALAQASGGRLGKATGTIYNARMEQLFKGIEFRKFNYNFQFAPESQQEADEVLSIISAFKSNMHPEKLEFNSFTSEYLFRFPNIFNIEFYTSDNKENLALNKIGDCALTSFTVNYAPNGQWASIRRSEDNFGDKNNKIEFDASYPPQINITAEFIELDQLTKQDLEVNKF